MIDILNAINDYILVINKEGVVEFCNQTLVTKLKYENNELDNININTILFGKNFNFIKNVSIDKKSDIELKFELYTILLLDDESNPNIIDDKNIKLITFLLNLILLGSLLLKSLS